ncbi:MAG: DUF2252 family protein [Deltaproteobacteria bacterium]|nr:DUF2252 family protein [Deltaproteobacteria bacterium]
MQSRRFAALNAIAPSSLVYILVLSTTGCGYGDENAARMAWLASSLAEDNFDLWARDPEGVAEKLAKMSTGPYAFFRGTLGQFVRDVASAGVIESTGLAHAGDARIMLIGDPHPENIGTYRLPSGVVIFDFNDFDAARFGPWILDVRRMAMGFVALQAELDHVRPAFLAAASITATPASRSAVTKEAVPDNARRWAAIFARSYAQALEDLRQAQARSETLDDSRLFGRGAGSGAILEDLLRRAQRDGTQATELETYVESNSPPQLYRGEIERRSDGRFREDELLELEGNERRIIELYLEPSLSRHIVDVARHLGQGVSSYPLLRYLILLKASTQGDATDLVLLELKEARDPAALALPMFPSRAFDDNADRIVELQRRLQVSTENDAWLGRASADKGQRHNAGLSSSFSFRVGSLTGFQKTLRVRRIQSLIDEAQLNAATDVADLARSAGRLLAHAHARGRTIDGEPALNVLPHITPDDLEQEIDAFVDDYGPRLETDFALFLRLLEEEGPTLGSLPR